MLAVSLAAGVLPGVARAGPWSFGAGGGWTSGYTPVRGGFDTFQHDGASSTWLWTMAIQREINPSARFKVEAAWLTYEGRTSSFDSYWIVPSGEPAFSDFTTDHHATFVPISAGIRWSGSLGRSGIAPYLEFMPTIFVVKWAERSIGTVRYGFGPPDSVSSFGHDQSFTRGVLGLTFGLGFHLRGGRSWDLDYGLQFRQSAPLDHEAELAPGVTRNPLNSLATLAMAVGFSWSPGSP